MHEIIAKEFEGHLDRYGAEETFPCMFCGHETQSALDILYHLYDEHKFVLSNPTGLSLLPKYLQNWRTNVAPLIDIQFHGETVKTIDPEAEEEQKLRDILHKMRLDSVMLQFEHDRTHVNENVKCLFCTEKHTGTWHQYLQWLFEKHGFNPGRPSNLVYIGELVHWLRSQIESHTCFHCGAKFGNGKLLRQHMKKKPHDKIPTQKRFDRYYMVNYLEAGRKWMDVDDRDIDDESDVSIEEGLRDFGDEPEINETKCLICDNVSLDPTDCLRHMETAHNFSLDSIKKVTGDNFYALVRFVNYARDMKQQQKCFVCGELVAGDYANHIEGHDQKCTANICDVTKDEKYLIPVIEGDALLTILEDTE